MRDAAQDRTRMKQRQQYVSDVFHALGQPLTEVQMSLEIALARELDLKGYRRSIAQALEATRRVVETANFMRQLAEAEDPGAREIVDLSRELRETVEDFEPVAECKQITLVVAIETGIRILADAKRLRRALLLLLDHALQEAIPGTRVIVKARVCDGVVAAGILNLGPELAEGTPRAGSAKQKEKVNRSLLLAQRMIAAIGGSLDANLGAAGNAIVIRIPVAVGSYRQSETRTLAS